MILDFEELIGRPKRNVKLTADEINYFDNLSVAITGGAGSIGSAIALQLLKETNSLVFLIDSDESRLHTFFVNLPEALRNRTRTHLADIRDLTSIREVLIKINPQLVVHAAALKHVSVLEGAPREAYLTNILGTRNVLLALDNTNIKSFVFVSTDKAANPINILGKTKLIGEYLTAFYAQKNASINCGVVRFGNVFLSRGSVLETFIAQINLREDLTVTDPEMDRFFIDLEEASALILKTIVEPHSGISILKMGQPVLILDLVKKLLKKLGGGVNYRIIGAKPGEKISEELFTQNELSDAADFGDYSFTSFTKKVAIDTLEKYDYSSDAESANAIDQLLKTSNEI